MPRVYQDGLPCTGSLVEGIVRETAAKGSRNYQIVQKLMDRGVKIEATESPDLLRLALLKAFWMPNRMKRERRRKPGTLR